jgi:CubicO group peptidase (beta-lactamase class C family)
MQQANGNDLAIPLPDHRWGGGSGEVRLHRPRLEYGQLALTRRTPVYQAQFRFSAATLTAVFAVYVLILLITLLRGGAPVLPPDAVRAMTTDQLTPAQKSRGGLLPGFFDGRSWGFCQAVYDSGAFGWDGGLGTSWLVDPSRDLTVIVLTQRMFESPDPPQVHRDIQAAAYAALA